MVAHDLTGVKIGDRLWFVENRGRWRSDVEEPRYEEVEVIDVRRALLDVKMTSRTWSDAITIRRETGRTQDRMIDGWACTDEQREHDGRLRAAWKVIRDAGWSHQSYNLPDGQVLAIARAIEETR